MNACKTSEIGYSTYRSREAHLTLTVFAAAPGLVVVAFVVSAAVVDVRLLLVLLVAAVVEKLRCLPLRHCATLISTAHRTDRVAFAFVVVDVCQQFASRSH